MNKNMTVIKDVAQKAGVSVATVSRVINNDKAVAPKTKEKVERIIDELGYRPNLLGRNLRRLETKKILVLLPTISNPFYSRVVRGIEDKAKQNGYSIMICMTHSDRDIENEYLNMLKTRLVDGVIFFAPIQDAQTMTNLAQELPIVQCCEYVDGAITSMVGIDNRKAAYEATSYLIGEGHTRLAFLGYGNFYSSSVSRELGFRDALRDHNISPEESIILYDDYSVASGIRSAKRLLSLPKRPTAVFAVSDDIAVGVMKEFFSCGIRVPQDISVMGFDDNSIASVYRPSITTVRQPRYDLGCCAMELLLNKLDDIHCQDETIWLGHSLIIRESTNSKGE